MGKTPMFCDVCGDIVKVVYPVKVIFPHGGKTTFYVCLDCYHNGVPLKIDVKHKEQIAEVCNIMAKSKDKWLNRLGMK